MILLKEFVQAKAELKSFAVNEIERLVRTCFFFPVISLIAVQILFWETLFLIIVSKYVFFAFLIRFFTLFLCFLYSTREPCLRSQSRCLLKHGSRVEYKKQRNNVKNLIRKAKKTYFETIIKNKVSQKSIWTAINEITGKKKHVRTNLSISLTANDFSSAFACTNSFSNIISDDDLFKASHWTQAFCQENF